MDKYQQICLPTGIDNLCIVFYMYYLETTINGRPRWVNKNGKSRTFLIDYNYCAMACNKPVMNNTHGFFASFNLRLIEPMTQGTPLQ